MIRYPGLISLYEDNLYIQSGAVSGFFFPVGIFRVPRRQCIQHTLSNIQTNGKFELLDKVLLLSVLLTRPAVDVRSAISLGGRARHHRQVVKMTPLADN